MKRSFIAQIVAILLLLTLSICTFSSCSVAGDIISGIVGNDSDKSDTTTDSENDGNTSNSDSNDVYVKNVEIRDGKIYVIYSDGTEAAIGTTTTNQTIENNTITINSDGSTNTELTAAKAIISSVEIVCTFTSIEYVRTQSGWKQQETEFQQGGSGVIYQLDKTNGDAYIITNYHVVYSSDSIQTDHICDNYTLSIYGESSYITNVTYVGGSANYDIAVLKVEDSDVLKNAPVQAVTVANSNDVVVGQSVLVCGNAAGYGISCTSGIVSVESEYIAMTSIDNSSTSTSFRVIRIDAPVNSGNSGGGLFNADGELIGIVNAKTSSTSIENIGYALPASVAVAIAQNIIDYNNGHVMRCIVGMTMTENATHLVYDTEKGTVHTEAVVVVSAVTEGALAAEMGIQADDQIISITISGRNAVEVKQTYTLVDEMLNARVGDTVTITLVRNGETKTVSTTLTDDCLTQY